MLEYFSKLERDLETSSLTGQFDWRDSRALMKDGAPNRFCSVVSQMHVGLASTDLWGIQYSLPPTCRTMCIPCQINTLLHSGHGILAVKQICTVGAHLSWPDRWTKRPPLTAHEGLPYRFHSTTTAPLWMELKTFSHVNYRYNSGKMPFVYKAEHTIMTTGEHTMYVGMSKLPLPAH